MTREPPAHLFEDDHSIGQLRIPPHSAEAESSVLGGLLLDAGAWDRVGGLLAEGDFFRHEHRLIFAAICQLAASSQPVDVVTVFNQLGAKGEEVGGMAYLSSLSMGVPSASNIRKYAEIVRERSILRRLVGASDEIATAAFNPNGKPVATILDEAERKILTIGQAEASAADDWQSMDEAMVELLDRINLQSGADAEPDFTPTYLSDLDTRLDGGMRGGELIVLAARSGIGKSAGGLTIAVNVATRKRKPCLYFSFEMPRAQLQNRAMAMQAQIHLSRIKRPERLRDHDWPSITEGVERLRQAPLFINDQPRLNINQVRSKARGMKRRHGKLGCIVVDHLGLMAALDPRLLRTYQLAEITQGLKGLAKELGCPVILLVQVNRAADDRPDPMPTLADLRDSASIEDDADVVMFIDRPIKRKPDLGDEWKPYAKAFVAKLRDGEPGYFHLWYTGEHTHFQDWPIGMEIPKNEVRTKREGKPL
jgi:replicative DNA helicase